MIADVEIIRQLHWDGFLNFSFRDPLPSEHRQHALLTDMFRMMSLWRKVYFPDLLYLHRFELGEITHREHYHGLVAFRSGPAHLSFYKAAEHYWNDIAGFAKFRVFDPSLNGVDYVLEGITGLESSTAGANKYEVGKFRRAETHVPESVRRVVLAAQRRSGFWNFQKSVSTAAGASLGRTARSAIMRGQKLGAVEHDEKRGVRVHGVECVRI